MFDISAIPHHKAFSVRVELIVTTEATFILGYKGQRD
jgi:hypothetical protein